VEKLSAGLLQTWSQELGIESQGMVLAAGENEVLGLLNLTDEIPAGTKIK